MANGLSKALLGGQQGAQLSPSGQTRVDLARALASRSIGGGPVQGGPLDALSRVGQAFFARQMLDEQQQAEQQKQQALAQTLQRVTRAGQQGVVTGPGGGGTGEVATPNQRIMDALSSNPQTAPMAAQLTLEQALKGPEAQTQTLPGEIVNQTLGTGLDPRAAVTVERDPQGNLTVTDVEAPTERQAERRTISAEEANERFGTTLNPGAAVTIERPQGAREFSIVDVEGGVERREEGEPGGFAGQTEERQFNELETNARNLIANTQEAIDLLEENPDINTFVGRGASIINSFTAEARALGRQIGGEEFDPENLNPDRFEDTFRELGIESDRMKSLVQSMAYSIARTREGGRLSEPDIRSAIRTVGANTSDPEAFKQILRDVARRTARRVQITAQILGVEPSGPLNVQEQGTQQGDVIEFDDGTRIRFD